MTRNRNPYLADEKKPKLINSVFAFMDILGYSDLMMSLSAKRRHQEELEKLHQTIRNGRNELEGKNIHPRIKNLSSSDRYAIKAFTDNIVIGWPIRDDAESELGEAFEKVGKFQFDMLKAGYFIRGAITIGDAYIDEYAVFGPALIEAYEAESNKARDPRIILTKSATEATKKHLEYYSDSKHSPQNYDLIQDSDGQWFVNYLNNTILGEEFGVPLGPIMQHKKSIESKLSTHKEQPAIWSKYAWTANYHNFFCESHRAHFDKNCMIDINLFKAQLRPIAK